jgi:NCAIR mutase (PurE)-related protein
VNKYGHEVSTFRHSSLTAFVPLLAGPVLARFPRDPSVASWQSRGVTSTEAIALLQKLESGLVDRAQVLRAFQAAPVADLGFASVDTHRALRKGFPEVIYGEGKTPEQVARIAVKIAEREQRFLITRVNDGHVRAVRRKLKAAIHHETARCITFEKALLPKRPGFIAVLAAGTSDLPVAEEAAVTAIQQANVIIAVAGMEGALPGVVTGLVSRPVIAVPTSVGYGVNLGGLTALFGMLSSCSSGLTVVNIDNGFGAGYAASQINSLAAEAQSSPQKNSVSARLKGAKRNGKAG